VVYINYVKLSGSDPDSLNFMPRKIIQFSNGNIYHVMARGNNQQDIFYNDVDYFRMIQDLFEFNDEETIDVRYRQILYSKLSGSDPDSLEPDSFGKRVRKRRKRKLLVEILVFCLMPNHMHLLLRQSKKDGISDFMKKIKGGYAAYFNTKHNRSGSLFQSHVKAVEIETDIQLNNIFSYIHTNPCQLVEPGWKEAGVSDKKMAVKILKDYRWSSYLDYIGIKNFPSLTSREMFLELYGGLNGCRKNVEDWVSHKADVYEDVKDIALE